jgi:hypothetical protein
LYIFIPAVFLIFKNITISILPSFPYISTLIDLVSLLNVKMWNTSDEIKLLEGDYND